MHRLTILLLIFLTSNIFSQEILTDLVIRNICECRDFGVSNQGTPPTYSGQAEITKLIRTDSVLFVTIVALGSVHDNIIGNSMIFNDTLCLNSRRKCIDNYRMISPCLVEYTFILRNYFYEENAIKFNDNIVVENKCNDYYVPEVYTIVNMDTINRRNDLGCKYGYWYEEFENNGYRKGYFGLMNSFGVISNSKGKIEEKLFYNSKILKSFYLHNDTIWEEVNYYENGNVKDYYCFIQKKSHTEKKYYQNENISHFIFDDFSGNEFNREYYETGELKAEFFRESEQRKNLTAIYYNTKGEITNKEFTIRLRRLRISSTRLKNLINLKYYIHKIRNKNKFEPCYVLKSPFLYFENKEKIVMKKY